MTIRESNKEDFEKLIDLFKGFFLKHNVFSKSKNEIIEYLTNQSKTNRLILDEDEGKIKSAMVIVLKSRSKEHSLWKLRHFAYEDEKSASDLLDMAEEIINTSSTKAKIELTLSEDEKTKVILEKNGYKKEGSLSNHYRFGEDCFVYGKSID